MLVISSANTSFKKSYRKQTLSLCESLLSTLLWLSQRLFLSWWLIKQHINRLQYEWLVERSLAKTFSTEVWHKRTAKQCSESVVTDHKVDNQSAQPLKWSIFYELRDIRLYITLDLWVNQILMIDVKFCKSIDRQSTGRCLSTPFGCLLQTWVIVRQGSSSREFSDFLFEWALGFYPPGWAI